MKTMKSFTFVVLAVLFSIGISAQNQKQQPVTKTESFMVMGKCGMCKTRIEKAVTVGGVSKAEWDADKQLLTVTYNPAKVKIEDLQKKVAAVGHDTEKFKADDKVYDKLPGCCKYERMK